MPKLSKRQLQSRKNSLSLQKHLDDNGRYQKKRATVEIADDADDRTAQQEWSLLIHELSGSESVQIIAPYARTNIMISKLVYRLRLMN